MRTCTIPGCSKRYEARGWCQMHYRRWKTHGDPLRSDLINGSPEVRFWNLVNKTDSCWEWTGYISKDGYAKFSIGRKSFGAHRWSYEQAKGPIPDGLQIDHLCRNPKCVRPDHLEAVPPRVNLLRSESLYAKNARKTHCLNGHEFTPENTYRTKAGFRQCKTCSIRRAYEHLARKREKPKN